MDAGEVLVGGRMAELDEPGGEAELCGDAGDGAGVCAELEGVDEAVYETDESGGVGMAEGEVGGRGWLRAVLQDDAEEGVCGLERMWKRSDCAPCCELLT